MDTVSVILDIVWFILVYDIFRALAEAIASDFLKKGGVSWERKVSWFDIPIACLGIAFCVFAMPNMQPAERIYGFLTRILHETQ